MAVSADGKVLFTGMLNAGERRTWNGGKAVHLRVGNAGGVRLNVNGQDLGAPGTRGQVWEKTFRAEAVAPVVQPPAP